MFMSQKFQFYLNLTLKISMDHGETDELCSMKWFILTDINIFVSY